MPELSPQAQAVWDAYELVDCDGFAIDPRQAGLAAALEAVADQVVPQEPWHARLPIDHDGWCSRQRYMTRHRLLAIANELKAQ